MITLEWDTPEEGNFVGDTPEGNKISIMCALAQSDFAGCLMWYCVDSSSLMHGGSLHECVGARNLPTKWVSLKLASGVSLPGYVYRRFFYIHVYVMAIY